MSERETRRVGEVDPGDRTFSFKKTLSGAAPHTVVLADHDIPKLVAGYRIFPHGETSSRMTVDESTITQLGFNLLSGADTEVAHVLVHGTVDG